MDTLLDLGLIRRDSQSKNYQGLARIVSIADTQIDFHTALSSELVNLSKIHGQSAEWWEPSDGELQLGQRQCAEENELQVRVQLGFSFAREKLEVVPMMARVHFGIHPKKGVRVMANNDLGELIYPDEEEVAKRLKQAEESIIVDQCINARGVRRIAGLVMGSDGPRGALSLAIPDRPWIDDLMATYGADIQAAVKRLERAQGIN